MRQSKLKLSGRGQRKLKLSGNGNECKPLPSGQRGVPLLVHVPDPRGPGEDQVLHHVRVSLRVVSGDDTPVQELTLVHYLAQRKRFLWDRGCMYGFFRVCLGVSGGVRGVFWVRNGTS
jgi:hypothetical protein